MSEQKERHDTLRSKKVTTGDTAMSYSPLDDLPPVDPRRHSMETTTIAILRVMMESGLSNSEQIAVLARLTADFANRSRRPPQTEPQP
jgi:hypothetical protein